MLKYKKGQEFTTKQALEFPKGYKPLEKGTPFIIEIVGTDDLDFPYLVKFPNGFQIPLSETEIEDLAEQRKLN